MAYKDLIEYVVVVFGGEGKTSTPPYTSGALTKITSDFICV